MIMRGAALPDLGPPHEDTLLAGTLTYTYRRRQGFPMYMP